MSNWIFQYRAQLLRVVDGDTFDVYVDKGFNDFSNKRIRVLSPTGGVNTPELHDPDPVVRAAAQAAKLFTTNLLNAWSSSVAVDKLWPLKLVTSKSDVFDRWLAIITPNGYTDVDLGTQLLESGNAKVWVP